MIIYKCDICGKVVPLTELVSLHATPMNNSSKPKLFETCPDCFKAITEKKPEPKKKRERLTDPCWRNFDPWECCGLGEDCARGANDGNGCNKGCKIPKLYARLAEYEDREEKGAEI